MRLLTDFCRLGQLELNFLPSLDQPTNYFTLNTTIFMSKASAKTSGKSTSDLDLALKVSTKSLEKEHS